MIDYTILELWEQQDIKCVTAHIDKSKMGLSDELADFLDHTGLPLINSGNGKRFLPFTYLSLVKVKDKDFYLLGDYSWNFRGISFIGLATAQEKVYSISIKDNLYDIVNDTLHQFLRCLACYNLFLRKYNGSMVIIKKDFRQDYQRLKEELTGIDNNAMSSKKSFWQSNVDLLEVNGYGDYLHDYEVPENLPTQDEIDKMDFPF